MTLIPLYFSHSRLLVGLQEDYLEESVNDGLVIEIDLATGKSTDIPWSGQKIIKHGYFDSIAENEREDFILKIKEVLNFEEIEELETKLLFPSEESIESLVWLPERLKKRKEALAKAGDSEIRKTLESLIAIRHKLFQDALNYAMKNELKEINDVFDEGEVYEFDLSHLDNSKDANLQLLVDLIKKVESTAESIANLNKLDLDVFET